ncbi:ABC transporter substrate-binding protein [Pseudonocardia sp. Ae356_Ps1]|uniref:ABC transporter substrate-binding protein n=2 Tax=Pseudonocardia TaxID=1847 RepID=UPI00158AA886|nr:ABC transporter substrate-binding protein [Pseudonocardia sp. Ae356_Ps1]
MLLTACGSGGGGGDDNDTAGGAAETRTVTDDFGTQVTVPVAPQRVVTTHFLLTMGTLDLGVAPVGTAVWAPANVTDRYAATLADVPVVASQTAEPELEKIAAQSPDLILATSFNDEQVIGRLREIAPTYVVDVSAGGANATSWSERTSQLADVLGRTAEAGTLASAFEQRKQQLIQTHANQINGTTAAVVTGFRDDNASVFAAESGIGQIVTSLGFTYSPQATVVAAGAQNGIANVSFERITTSVGDAEVLFLGSDLNGGLSPVVTALQQTQLYRDLPAVRANRVGVFKPQVTGYTDANFALDQIEQTLTGMQG